LGPHENWCLALRGWWGSTKNRGEKTPAGGGTRKCRLARPAGKPCGFATPEELESGKNGVNNYKGELHAKRDPWFGLVDPGLTQKGLTSSEQEEGKEDLEVDGWPKRGQDGGWGKKKSPWTVSN